MGCTHVVKNGGGFEGRTLILYEADICIMFPMCLVKIRAILSKNNCTSLARHCTADSVIGGNFLFVFKVRINRISDDNYVQYVFSTRLI